MTKATKQTAGNNADLARIKKMMSGPIFREASERYNAEGREACKRYVGQFFNDEARPDYLSRLFGEDQ